MPQIALIMYLVSLKHVFLSISIQNLNLIPTLEFRFNSFMAKLAYFAAALLAVATPLQAHARTPYDTAIWSTARNYCGLVESGMTPDQALIAATKRGTRLWDDYTKNDPQRFYARVRAAINEQCVQQAVPDEKDAASYCPGLSVAQMGQIANGQRVRVNWPGCNMEFN